MCAMPDGTITLHDNGYPHLPEPSRAPRFVLDTTARTATLVEQKNEPDGIASPLCCGSARKLPGGNWLMAGAAPGSSPR